MFPCYIQKDSKGQRAIHKVRLVYHNNDKKQRSEVGLSASTTEGFQRIVLWHNWKAEYRA